VRQELHRDRIARRVAFDQRLHLGRDRDRIAPGNRRHRVIGVPVGTTEPVERHLNRPCPYLFP